MYTIMAIAASQLLIPIIKKTYKNEIVLFTIGYLLLIAWFTHYTVLNYYDSFFLSLMLMVLSYVTFHMGKFYSRLIIIVYSAVSFKVALLLIGYVGDLYEKITAITSHLPFG